MDTLHSPPDVKPDRVQELEAACRAEHQRGLAGHWSYSLVRHQAMLRQLKAEREKTK